MISFKHTGDFSKTTKFLERAKRGDYLKVLDKYGKEALEKTITDAISILK